MIDIDCPGLALATPDTEIVFTIPIHISHRQGRAHLRVLMRQQGLPFKIIVVVLHMPETLAIGRDLHEQWMICRILFPIPFPIPILQIRTRRTVILFLYQVDLVLIDRLVP